MSAKATALYNEIDDYAADWLENLVEAGHIAPGRVDRRSIVDLKPEDVAGAGQRHFFAGIGVWSHALRLAGWPDDLGVWTGSCPCQPFSTAGRKRGTSDERHLWPEWFRLIRECHPDVVLGEQVSSPDALKWLDAVCADLEGIGYAVGAISTNAASVGAPHIRQRIYFVAVRVASDQLALTGGERREGFGLHLRERGSQSTVAETRGGSEALSLSPERELGNSCESRGWRHSGAIPDAQAEGSSEREGTRRVADVAVAAGDARLVADDDDERRGSRRAGEADGGPEAEPSGCGPDLAVAEPTGPVNGFWAECDWIPCSDGKSRPVEPGTFPLAHGAPTRVGRDGALETQPRAARLKGYGNAIVDPLAAEFVRCVMDVLIEMEAA